ncbi:MAG: PepSY domain-containing protein [Actinomycetota bacterium]
MDTRRKLAIGAASAVVVLALGGGIAIAARSDDDEPLLGDHLQRATAAALRHPGGGTVVETEAGDDGAAFSVEVRIESGRVVEVNLNADFDVIGAVADDDGAGDEDENDVD